MSGRIKALTILSGLMIIAMVAGVLIPRQS